MEDRNNNALATGGLAAVIAASTVALTLAITNLTGAVKSGLMEDDTLVCGAYTMANEDMTGCELLPGYTVIEGEPAEGDPEWDCRIHGNRVCGPDSPYYAG